MLMTICHRWYCWCWCWQWWWCWYRWWCWCLHWCWRCCWPWCICWCLHWCWRCCWRWWWCWCCAEGLWSVLSPNLLVSSARQAAWTETGRCTIFTTNPQRPIATLPCITIFFTIFSSLPTVLTFFAESCKADSNLIDPKTKVLLLIWILPPSPNPSDALYSYLGCNGPPTARGRQIGNHRSPSLIRWNHHPFPPEEGL